MDSAILALAFGLGMLHAVDADHIAGHGPSRRHALLAGGLWALGHGLCLLLFGTAVLLVGMAIPERFGALAEQLIALVLIGIGPGSFGISTAAGCTFIFIATTGMYTPTPETARTTGLIRGAPTRGAPLRPSGRRA